MSDIKSDDFQSESDLGSDSPASKRQRVAINSHGATKYRVKFNKEWKVSVYRRGDRRHNYYSYNCTICKRNVKCSHMGLADVERYTEIIPKRLKSQATLSYFAQLDPVADKVSKKCCLSYSLQEISLVRSLNSCFVSLEGTFNCCISS